MMTQKVELEGMRRAEESLSVDFLWPMSWKSGVEEVSVSPMRTRISLAAPETAKFGEITLRLRAKLIWG